jgi:membrane-bound metal-dependent hydrolase YbcI (DUF457 family)
MNPITHALAGWTVAEAVPSLSMRDRTVIVLAGIAPDFDGFGIVPELVTRDTTSPLLWWTEYHHLLFHNLPSAIAAASIAALATRGKRALVASLAFVSFHLHLICDLAGSKGPDGYQWPIPYFYPVSPEPQLVWAGQWPLNAWQNIALTVLLLAVTFALAWRRGYSPLGMFSQRADHAFVTTLRSRIPSA